MNRSDVPQACLLCGAPPEIVGLFVPERSEAWGAPKGKTRIVRYCLCLACQQNPSAPERVEKVIRSMLADGGVSHAD